MGKQGPTGAQRSPGRRSRGSSPRGKSAFTWTVCSTLGAELGYLVLDGAPLPFALGLITLVGAQGYIVRARSELTGAYDDRSGRREGRPTTSPPAAPGAKISAIAPP